MQGSNITDVVDSSPNVLELSALLEKQNEVLSALLGELETYKSEVVILRNKSSQQINNGDTQDEKPTYAGNFFKGFPKIEETLPHENEKSLTFKDFLEEIKKTRLETENLSRELEVKTTELSHAIETSSLKQTHIDHLNELMKKEYEARNNEFSKLNDLLADKTQEYDSLIAEYNAVKAQLKMLEDSNITKEKLVNNLSKTITKELEKRKEEDKVLAARLSVLADENMTLRTSLLTLGANELSPQSKKLIEQQQNFIETLKSECEILMNRLVRERNEHRKERKQLRRQIRSLNARIEHLISGKQEIIDA
ncbi:hypothetical protein X798_00627 [Onchocerca flexuosa]|uniref:Uncharacterized protein n=1 Tax=Onchocerca flexuosa TaxID=387005 RepID=A0A238C5A7_9BILA|nr:hypothetical protein X798_00627 [Onchocerca flexuosa]